MKRIAFIFLLAGLVTTPAFAQGRGRNAQGIPPGHLPPEGSCRVWYDGGPPGHQPSPMSCYEAERIASRDRRARVVYGTGSRRNAPVYRGDRSYPEDIWRDDDRRGGGDGRRPNANGRTTGRAVPRSEYPDRYPYPEARDPQSRRGSGYESEGFRRGYEDGIVKGREDVRDRDRFDPARHGWYRSADRGYNSRYGSREDYRTEYRRGFLAGYESVHDVGRFGSRIR
jgi:hypothetical protein